MNKHFRIGLLGGMGPEAGILMQRLIMEMTPAEKDQDHLEVVAFTNPHVPDRTMSLAQDGGASYLAAVIESLQLLEKTGVDILVMACNTAHARLPEMQARVRTPMLNMVELARKAIHAASGPVGILATDGTLNSGLFAIAGEPGKIVTPDPEDQGVVMSVIRDIKAGAKGPCIVGRLVSVIAGLRSAGCGRFVLGCTELSVVYEELRERLGDCFIDPLRLAAAELVNLAGKHSG
ncbi:MAG TPA: amino acid racemase [Candidatus Sumerlaeota bacterium]|nr:amino acid racemase [Candidatus Sumerlaeota bacterium]